MVCLSYFVDQPHVSAQLTSRTGKTASEDRVHAHLASALRRLFAVNGVPGLGETLALWPQEPYASEAVSPNELPVLDHLDAALANAPAAFRDTVDFLAAARGRLQWRQTYTEADLGPAFIERYGWTMIVGSSGPIVSQNLIAGFLLLGPGTEYPPHQHSIEEYYRIVSGQSLWKIGDGDWVERMPGDVVHNPPWQVHGMRPRSDAPLLIACLGHSATIEKSIFPTA